MWCEALFSPQKNPSVKLRVESRCCRARIALLLTRRTHVNDREGTMVKFLKVRVLQRTLPDPPLARASRGKRPSPAMRRPAARSPRCPAVAACARLGRRRASPRRPWTRPTERAAGRPCCDSAVCARRRLRRRRRGDGRARSVDPRARGAAMGYFFPRRVRRKRRQRDDRDAIDAERRAPRHTRRASSARRRSVIHRRRAAAAGRRAGLCFSF